MRAIEDLANWLADMDWGWWPLLSLRPAKDQEFDGARILGVVAFFGPITGIALSLVAMLGSYARTGSFATFSIASLVTIGILGVASFAALFSVTVLSWNRRARRLRAERDRS